MLAGLWRRDLLKAAGNARDYSIEHVFATAEELCASPEVDAVFVTSPDALHLPHVLLALAHGKPVLCEKPLGMRAEEVEHMLASAQAAVQCLGVAQNLRYNTSLEVMREWIAEGRIGQPVLAHAQLIVLRSGGQPAAVDLRSGIGLRRTDRRCRHPLHRCAAFCAG